MDLSEAVARLTALGTTAPEGLRERIREIALELGAAADPPGPAGSLGRFRDLGPLGVGGMGEVRRVFDPVLGRTLALKVLPRETGPDLERRFLEEARIGARLEHPAIVPIHELGTFPDGRSWFTMREVRGRTLGEVIAEGAPLRRLLDLLRRVADAVAYAHARGVVHRDLKPANVMVGDFGEVFVLDWGIAKVLGRAELPTSGEPAAEHGPGLTRDGTVMGTPAYMSPEQAEADPARIGPATDVWGLGAMLYEVLAGRRPIMGDVWTVMARLSDPDLVVQRAPTRAPLDHPLWELCEACLARDPSARPAHAGLVADALGAWLDGERSRERALEILGRAVRGWPEADELRARATSARARAAELLSALPPWAPEVDRWAAWALEDEARELEVRAEVVEVAAEQGVGAALAEVPTLPEAHAALARRYRAAAEAADPRDRSAATRAEVLLERHARALPAEHPERASHLAWLAGTGTLEVSTGVPAEVELERYVEEHRRLVARPEAGWRSPAGPRPLASGSWRLRVRAPGRPEVLVPVVVGRSERRVVRIDPPGEVPPGTVYVAPGPFVAGGDPLRPRRVLTCDGFVIGRFPVTMGEYVLFLNDLVASGREGEAVAHAPQVPSGRYGAGPQMLPREPDGRFRTGLDPDGDLVADDWPALCVAWSGAVAYARWMRSRTGLPWRLPGELEWEKAARGVDGRTWPWGEQPDPSRANCRDSREGRSGPVGVDSCPLDESPYGMRGAAGNVRDWTGDAWCETWAPLDGDRVIPPPLDPPEAPRVVGRGGAWPLWSGGCSATARTEDRPDYRHPGVGFRIACSWPIGG